MSIDTQLEQINRRLTLVQWMLVLTIISVVASLILLSK
jgi:competence protein ComGC